MAEDARLCQAQHRLGPQCLKCQAHRRPQSGQLREGCVKRCQPTWGGNLSRSEASASAISSTTKPVPRPGRRRWEGQDAGPQQEELTQEIVSDPFSCCVEDSTEISRHFPLDVMGLGMKLGVTES